MTGTVAMRRVSLLLEVLPGIVRPWPVTLVLAPGFQVAPLLRSTMSIRVWDDELSREM